MKELAIIGTSMIDQVFTANHSLQFNQCNKGSMSISVGGSMCNIARNCALLDFNVHFYTILGSDGFAQLIRNTLTIPQITLHETTIDMPSPLFAFLSDRVQHMKLSTISPAFLYQAPFTVEQPYVLTDNEKLLPLPNKVIFSGSIPNTTAHLHGLIINREEALSVDSDLEKAITELKKRFDWVIITCDKDGVLYALDTIKKQKACTQKAGYSLGCGDTFAAAFMSAYLNEIEFDECIHYAQRAAAEKYQHPDVVCPSISKIKLSQQGRNSIINI